MKDLIIFEIYFKMKQDITVLFISFKDLKIVLHFKMNIVFVLVEVCLAVKVLVSIVVEI